MFRVAHGLVFYLLRKEAILFSLEMADDVLDDGLPLRELLTV